MRFSMLKISVTDASSVNAAIQMSAFIITDDASGEKEIKKIEKKYYPGLTSLVAQQSFSGAAGSTVTVPMVNDSNGVSYLVLAGVGKKKGSSIDIETYRRAIGRIIRTAQAYKCTSVAIEVPSATLFKTTVANLVQQTVVIARMAYYHYDRFFTDEGTKKNRERELALEIVVPAAQKNALKKQVGQAEIIAESVNLAREWVDAPPGDLTPPELAGKARSIAKEFGLGIKVFDEQKVKKMGMGGLAAVSAGSDRDCQLVILEYNCGKKNAPTIAFVGKGITFDSGGLSLKPAQYMETMKEDMSGAAAVIASMRAIAQLKPKINVVGIAPLSENLPSGKATKPGDVITFYNGKTAEVRNTDAEGRLVLADALSYAVKHYTLDAIIDIATLTGACAYALGPFFTGLMSQHEQLTKRLQESADRTGDRVWPLPLDDDYKVAIKSSMADICNIGSKRYNAGAITAGFFLQNFVDDTPWVHLDIAGTAFDVPDISYYRSGATGVGVRLLIDLAQHWQS